MEKLFVLIIGAVLFDQYPLIAASCSARAKQLACSLTSSSGVTLAQSHSSGVSDRATPWHNLNDMCNGLAASRSSYSKSCPDPNYPAPGGTVCVSEQVLEYLLAILPLGSFRVNELAGGCHSRNSKHYSGLAVDLALNGRQDSYVRTCLERGSTYSKVENGNHVHCQF